MALTDQQRECVKLIVRGEKITNIASVIGVNRKTVYEWMKKEEFKTEVDKQTKEIRDAIKNNISSKSELVVDKVLKIALSSKSEKASLDACTYLLDQVLGKATTKIETKTEKNKKDEVKNINELMDKVHELKVVK